MVTEMKNVGRDESLRMDQLRKNFEVGQVVRVWTHNDPEDWNWQHCDVIIQDAVPSNPSSVPPNGPAHRLRVPVLQRHIGNRSGTPWTPRVGDSVLIGFYMNDRPVIVGTMPPNGQKPVCRSSAHQGIPPDGAHEDWDNGDYDNYFDWRFRLDQWLRIPRRSIDDEHGKPWETTFDHSKVTLAGKLRPVCFSYFDKTRDCMAVFECKKGKAVPDCKLCELNGDGSGDGPDYIECESEPLSGSVPAMNTWLKILSSDYEGSDDIARRFKLHWSCGSLFCVDSKCGNGTEGRIWLEAQKAHVGRSHIHFRAEDTGVGANLSLRSAPSAAAHIELFGVNDPKKGRIWLSNEDKGNYIDIKEDGDIEVVAKAGQKVYIHGPAEVHIVSAGVITLDGNVRITGGLSIDGACSHGPCSCLGAQDFTTYSEADPNSRVTVTASKAACSDLTCAESAYVCKDFGADYFQDVRILFGFKVNAISGGACGCCSLTNANAADIFGATGYKLVCEAANLGGSVAGLLLWNGSSVVTYDTADISIGTQYYCILRKPDGENVASLEIYTDQNMTELLDTLSISDANIPAAYRYLYGLSSLNTGSGGSTISCDVENMTVSSH